MPGFPPGTLWPPTATAMNGSCIYKWPLLDLIRHSLQQTMQQTILQMFTFTRNRRTWGNPSNSHKASFPNPQISSQTELHVVQLQIWSMLNLLQTNLTKNNISYTICRYVDKSPTHNSNSPLITVIKLTTQGKYVWKPQCCIIIIKKKKNPTTSTVTHSKISLIYMYQDPKKKTCANIYSTTYIHVSKMLLLLIIGN